MFNGSYLRACMKLWIVQKIRFSLLESGRTKPWCPGLVSRPSAKAQEPLARSRGQWQEVKVLLFSPQNSQVVHILSFHSQAVVSKFIFPTGQIALDSVPRGRRYVKNTGHNRNRLYSRAIHCPASMEKHYVQWFLLKSVQDITICEKIRLSLLDSGRTKACCPSLVSRPSAKAQEPVARSRGLVIQPPKPLVGAYFELSLLGCGFLIHLANRSDSPQFQAPWKKIRQKYGRQQEQSLFKGHPLSCQYGEALCSMVPSSECVGYYGL